jgi:hypothetical protein
VKLTTVESTMIHAVGYDAESQTLEVIFNSGGIYFYDNVPPKVYEELMAAASKGSYMKQAIIDVYPHSELAHRQ